MKNTQLVSVVWLLCLALTSSLASAQFGGLSKKSLLGGGSGSSASGGQSWKQLAKDFNKSRGEISNELQVQALLSADIADALGLKSEAEGIRGEAKSLEEKGDVLGSDDLNAIGDKSAATNNLIKDKLASAENLTEKQKEALSKAAKKYAPSLMRTIKTAGVVKDAVSAISSLGTPKFTDGKAAISAAKAIPSVGPAIIKLTAGVVKQGADLMSLMKTKGVATPKTSGLDFDM